MVNSSGISFSGLASGLDTQAIIKQLVALERIPIQMMEVKKSTQESKLGRLEDFEAKVKGLQVAAKKLSTAGEFHAWTVETSDPKVATIAAVGGAQAGTHTLEVLSLASADRWAFDGVIDPDLDLASLDGQQLSFTAGAKAYTLSVDVASSSLNDIAAAIEEMAGDDVTAEVVNTGTATNPEHRLILASKESGEESRISGISTDIAGLGITYSAPDADGNPTSDSNLTVGSNATVVIDGLEFERSGNDFSDVYEGIEIKLLSTTDDGAPISFTVGSDTEAIRENIDGFIDAYNAVVSFINQQSTYTPGDGGDSQGTTGELFGDSILTTVRANINRALFNVDADVVAEDTEGYSTLSLVGIKQANDGTLSIDSTVFDEKLAGNIELFADLFVDSDGFDNGGADPNTGEYFEDTTADSGLAASLVREIDRMFGTYEGPIDPVTGERMTLDALFDLKEDTIRTAMKQFDDRIESMEQRMEGFERNLVMRFARLEELMGALNAQGAALAGALAKD